MFRARLSLFLLCGFLNSCGLMDHFRTPLPEIARPRLEEFHPQVRAVIQTAWEKFQADPRSAGASGSLGMALQAHEQTGGALACYRRAHILDPKSLEWSYLSGVMFSQLSRFQEAETAFRDALKVDAAYQPARLQLADLLLTAGRLDESRKLFDAVIQVDADSPAAHYGLGRILVAQGKQEAAIAHYTKACDLFPHFGAAHFAWSQAATRLHRVAEADYQQELYLQAPGVRPPAGDRILEQVTSLQTGPRLLTESGLQLSAAGRLQEAAIQFRRVLDDDPADYNAHMNLLMLDDQLGETTEALEHYQAALKLNPEVAELHRAYGAFLMRRKKYAEAKVALEKAVALKPGYPEAHAALGEVLEVLGKPKEALPHYRQAVAVRSSITRGARYNLGRLLITQGDCREAIMQLESLVEPEDALKTVVLYNLGKAYQKAGVDEKARYYLRQAEARADARGPTWLYEKIGKELHALSKSP